MIPTAPFIAVPFLLAAGTEGKVAGGGAAAACPKRPPAMRSKASRRTGAKEGLMEHHAAQQQGELTFPGTSWPIHIHIRSNLLVKIFCNLHTLFARSSR